IYTFEGEGVRLTLTSMMPMLPDDLDLLSRPTAYVTWQIVATDGRTHEVRANFDAYPEIAVNEPRQEVETAVKTASGLTMLSVGTVEQAVLGKKGDDLRIDWGRFYLATAEPVSHRQQTLLQPDRGKWWLTDKGSLPTKAAPAKFSQSAQVLSAYFD